MPIVNCDVRPLSFLLHLVLFNLILLILLFLLLFLLLPRLMLLLLPHRSPLSRGSAPQHKCASQRAPQNCRLNQSTWLSDLNFAAASWTQRGKVRIMRADSGGL
eukprot:1916245-Pyramimonas_sp.AAC.1